MEPKFEDILKAKRDYYGHTEGAIQFAAEEYARQMIAWDKIKLRKVCSCKKPWGVNGICVICELKIFIRVPE